MNLEKKFSKLYRKNVSAIYRFIFLKVNSKEIAEDLTGQVFLKSWQRFSQQEKEKIRNPRAYFFQLARNELARFYKEKEKFKIVSAFEKEIPDPKSNLEFQGLINIQAKKIISLIPSLGQDYQDVLLLKYVEGLSTKEIAQILGKSEGAVRVLAHRALSELREKLKSVTKI